MSKAKRAALYLRVSTGEQTVENQRLALLAEAERRGWRVVAEYEDAGISGAKGRDKRPGLDRMLRDATRGRFDVAMGWALDRLGRSLADLIATLQSLEAARVDLFLHQQAIDTTSASGRLFFHVLGAFAEFERSMIRTRVNAGLDRARAKGVRLGRPRLDPAREAAVRQALQSGQTVYRVCRDTGVGSATVQRIKRELAGQPTPERNAA